MERRQSQISLVLDDDEKEALARQQELSATGVSVEPIEGAASSMPGNAVVTQSDIVAGPPRLVPLPRSDNPTQISSLNMLI